MAEALNNDQNKQAQLKSIIRQLHEGKPLDVVKKQFERLIKNVSPDEIAVMENSLIAEGLPVEEVQRLCDVHARVFDSALKRYRHSKKMPGHPVFTYIEENKALKVRLKTVRGLIDKTIKRDPDGIERLRSAVDDLKKADIHYTRKENQMFPYLEKAAFTGPSKVMWGKHNEIREKLKSFAVAVSVGAMTDIRSIFGSLASLMKTMIFLEEKILFPTALKKITDDEWASIKEGEPEIGYAWVTPSNLWDAALARKRLKESKSGKGAIASVQPNADAGSAGTLDLDVGNVSLEQINLLLTNLPVDVSLVDENNRVVYYSQNKERIFPRSPGIIGRAVQNCHPQKSVHIVDKIIESFKKKEKKDAEFWITLDGKFIHIRYFPLFDNNGNYKGVIEVSQDVTGIRALAGEKRLLDW